MTQPNGHTLPPLTNLPEPARKPARSQEVDYPEEILLDSQQELRSVAGWKPYAWLVPIGAVSWTVLGWIFLLSLSPLMWLIALILMTDPGMTDAWLRQLGTSLGAVLLIIVGSPILGALLGAAAVPAGLWGVARVRPRYYLSEELFRTAVARRFAIAMVAPQVALMLLLVALSMLPGQFAWHQLSLSLIHI